MTDDDDAALKARLSQLSEKLAETDKSAAGKGAAGEPQADKALASAFGLGARVLGEFVAAVGVSALIGWQLDEWTGASPAFLLVFLGLGTAAGFWSVYKTATGNKATGYPGSRRK